MTQKKKMRSVLARAATLALAALFAAVPAVAAPGNIVFLGDSITQGGRYLAGPVPSYRYQLFKNFVDNGADFSPMGTTRGAAGGVDVSALTPPYRGKSFENVSESAASARSYQFSGHAGEKRFRPDPGTAFPPENRGPVTLKLGLPNPFVEDAAARENSFYDGAVLKKYAGDTYASLYGNEKADTLCVLVGINDLFDARETDAEIVAHVRGVVEAFQAHNPAVRVHVFETLPTGAFNGTGTHGKNNRASFNRLLRETAKSWSRGRSRVSCEDVSAGFCAEDGSMVDTARGAHPNAQGELVVAGNIARALGVGQRTAGLPRRAAEALPKKFSRVPSAGRAGPRTLAVRVKTSGTGSADAFLRIVCGNGGNAVGELLVGEKGVYWEDEENLLYGVKPDMAGKNLFAGKGGEWIRVVWKPDGETRGGFYVWLGSQLVGEALAGESAAQPEAPFLVSPSGKSGAPAGGATVLDVRFDDAKAWAPENERGAR